MPELTCTYPECSCPFDAPADPNWCARGLPPLPLSEGYGWIEWFGGKRPVGYNTHVDVITRGAGGTNIVAGSLRWNRADHPEDIFAYRVVPKPPLLQMVPPASCDGTRCPSRNNCLRHEEPGNFDTVKRANAMLMCLCQEAADAPSEQKPRFECWSTNEGDSWYDNHEDAELLYDVLGDSPKVGDEFEVMAGWYSVQARYRIASQTDDDFEVECISHPEDNTAPQTDYKAQRDVERLDFLEKLVIESRTGVSVDFVRFVEDGLVTEKGFRLATFHNLRSRQPSLREAIDAAIASVKGGAR